MPIKLIADSGGSVTLDVPTTASTYNLTIPASNGTFAIVDSAGYANFGTLGITFSNNVTVTNSVSIANNLTIAKVLSVTGNATFSNTVTVTGNAVFSNTIAVTGNATFSNTVTVAASGITFSDATTQTTAAVTAAAGSQLVSRTAVSASGSTNIDFTGIPSWVKRITVILTNVGNPSSNPQIQLGTSGGFVTSGYQNDIAGSGSGGTGGGSQTTGHALAYFSGSYAWTGATVFDLIGSNVWVGTGITKYTTGQLTMASSYITLSGALDRIRYTTLAGGVTFSSGTINIMYE